MNYSENWHNGLLLSGTSHWPNGDLFDYSYLFKKAEPVIGLPEFRKLVTANIKYPKKAKREMIVGRVFISFIIDETGSISDAFVIHGIDPECDSAAVEALKSINTKWKPAKIRGKPSKSILNISVLFTL